MDGTLLDTLPYTIDVMNASLSELGYEIVAEEIYFKLLGASLLVMSKNLLSIVNPGYEEKELKQLMQTITKNIPYWNRYRKITMFETMKPVFDKLQRKDTAMVVISNTPHALVKELCKKHLPNVFTDIYGEGVIARKPSPEGIFKAVEQCHSDLEHTVLIGDTMVDFETSKNAGVKMIGVTWGALSRKELEEADLYAIAETGEEVLQALHFL